MAVEKKAKKRKGAPTLAIPVTDPPAKKSKKATSKLVELPRERHKSSLRIQNTPTEITASTISSAPVKINNEPARVVRPRKRAADFLSDDEEGIPEVPTAKAGRQSAPLKAVEKRSKELNTDDQAAATKEGKALNTEKAKKNIINAKPSRLDDISKEFIESSDSETDGSPDGDDQTEALIKGFESSGGEDPSGDDGFDPEDPLPKIPDSKKTGRKIVKRLKRSDQAEEPGTVYIGRIPHGFYEHQMRSYFSQFGDISRLRLSRNRVTGRSKHYAFVEFSSATVAKIVAQTMDNYLMYGHILKCKYVPQERLHPEIWKGANRRFKKTPWNKIEKKRLETGKTREKWSKSIEKEQAKRLVQAERLKDLGYDFELPKLKSVDEVTVQAKEDKVIDVDEPVSNGDENNSAKSLKASLENDHDICVNVPKPSGSQKPKEKRHKKRISANSVKDTPKQAPPESESAAKVTPILPVQKTKKAKKILAGDGKPKIKK